MKSSLHITHKIIIAALLIGLLGLCLIVLSRGVGPSDNSVDARPPAPVATFMLGDNYFYRQDDDRWGSETIGDTDDTLYAYGCTIASVALAASNLTGAEITPWELEQNLSKVDGFTDRGWLIWGKVQAATDGQVRAVYYDTPNHSDIDGCMETGGYPIVKIKLMGAIVHWVAIVGRTKDQYLIRDPLYGSREDGPVELSQRGKDIYSLRCVLAR